MANGFRIVKVTAMFRVVPFLTHGVHARAYIKLDNSDEYNERSVQGYH